MFNRLFLVLLLGLSAALLSGTAEHCGKNVTRPGWCGADTLYATGIEAADPETAGLAFLEYVTHVADSGEEFPDGASSWEFDRIDGTTAYEGTTYWNVWHYANLDRGRLLTRTVNVDPRGHVVFLLGCP